MKLEEWKRSIRQQHPAAVFHRRGFGVHFALSGSGFVDRSGFEVGSWQSPAGKREKAAHDARIKAAKEKQTAAALIKHRYFKVQWENAGVTEVVNAVCADSTRFSCEASNGIEKWICVWLPERKPMALLAAEKIIQEKVWKVNGGAWVEVQSLTEEQADQLM